MEGSRSRARAVVEQLTSAWLAGDEDAIARTLTADVRWWTPLTGDRADGPAGTSAVLGQLLEPLPQPLRLAALVASDDGSRCVVEMRSDPPGPGAPPALVTSVVALRDGRISAGRTYTDLQGRAAYAARRS